MFSLQQISVLPHRLDMSGSHSSISSDPALNVEADGQRMDELYA